MPMSTDHFAWWRERAGFHPLLTAEQELTLARHVQAWQADPDGVDARTERRGRRARDRLVAANLRLVITVARRHQRFAAGGCGLEDLIQGGNLGLIRAAEKFDPARGYKFSTYAYWWITQGVQNTIARDSHTIRMPTTFAGKMVAVSATAQALVMRLGREPRHDELAAALGINSHALAALLTLGGRCASLDRITNHDSDDTFLDTLAAPADPNDEDEQLQDLRSRISALPEHLARLVEARFCHGLPATEIAAQEQLTPIELRRRIRAAVGMLSVLGVNATLPGYAAELIAGDQLALFSSVERQSPGANQKVPGRVRRRPANAPLQSEQCTLLLAG